MKNIFRLTLSMMVLFTIISCEKKATGPELDGTWELRHVAGIQVPGVDPNFKPGNGNSFKFDGQNFEKYNDGKKVLSGSFTVTPEKDVPVNNRKANYSIKFNNEKKLYMLLSGNKFILFDGVIAADGTESTFEKQ